MTRSKLLRKIHSVLLPWPHPDERKAAIEQARQGKERSVRQARDAADVEAQIRWIAERNHIAAKIAETVIARHQRGEQT